MPFPESQPSIVSENTSQMRNCKIYNLKSESQPYGIVTSAHYKNVSCIKLIAGGVAFIVLTIGIFWYQFYRIQAGDSPPQWNQLHWNYLLLMLLCLPLDTLACGLRIWVVCRILHPDMGFWTCLKAEWANLAVSTLTPSQSGGGFGQIYMLSRGGVRVGTALTISLITFLGSLVGLFFIGLYSLLVSGISYMGPFFTGTIWLFILILAVMIFSLIWPGLFRIVISEIARAFTKMKKIDRSLNWCRPLSKAQTSRRPERLKGLANKLVELIYTYQNDVGRFLRLGKTDFVLVCLLSFIFIISRAFMAFLCLRFLGVKTSPLSQVLEAQMALIFLIYFAPTPGGSVLAESASLIIMANIIPVGFAPYYNLLWRGSTLYLPAVAGHLCLMQAILCDAHKVVVKRKRSDQSVPLKYDIR